MVREEDEYTPDNPPRVLDLDKRRNEDIVYTGMIITTHEGLEAQQRRLAEHAARMQVPKWRRAARATTSWLTSYFHAEKEPGSEPASGETAYRPAERIPLEEADRRARESSVVKKKKMTREELRINGFGDPLFYSITHSMFTYAVLGAAGLSAFLYFGVVPWAERTKAHYAQTRGDALTNTLSRSLGENLINQSPQIPQGEITEATDRVNGRTAGRNENALNAAVAETLRKNGVKAQEGMPHYAGPVDLRATVEEPTKQLEHDLYLYLSGIPLPENMRFVYDSEAPLHGHEAPKPAVARGPGMDEFTRRLLASGIEITPETRERMELFDNLSDTPYGPEAPPILVASAAKTPADSFPEYGGVKLAESIPKPVKPTSIITPTKPKAESGIETASYVRRAETSSYTIKPGENVWSVVEGFAIRYLGEDWERMTKVQRNHVVNEATERTAIKNHMRNKDLVHPGDVIRISSEDIDDAFGEKLLYTETAPAKKPATESRGTRGGVIFALDEKTYNLPGTSSGTKKDDKLFSIGGNGVTYKLPETTKKVKKPVKHVEKAPDPVFNLGQDVYKSLTQPSKKGKDTSSIESDLRGRYLALGGNYTPENFDNMAQAMQERYVMGDSARKIANDYSSSVAKTGDVRKTLVNAFAKSDKKFSAKEFETQEGMNAGEWFSWLYAQTGSIADTTLAHTYLTGQKVSESTVCRYVSR